jgi:hypothetical protein
MDWSSRSLSFKLLKPLPARPCQLSSSQTAFDVDDDKILPYLILSKSCLREELVRGGEKVQCSWIKGEPPSR